MKQSSLEKQLIIFLGHCKKNEATEDELMHIAETIKLVRKYLPFYKAERG